MSEAGQLLIAGRIPGEEIAFTILTADSTSFTGTDVSLMSVVAPVVSGRTYWVCYDTAIQSSTPGDIAALEIHEDALAGTRLQTRHHEALSTNLNSAVSRARFNAITTANKTFVLTGRRQSGAGTMRLNASAEFPTFLWVEYVEG